MYDDFDNFLRVAIKEYYLKHGKRHPVDFVSLVMASGAVSNMAWDSVKTGNLPRKAAYGALGLVALRYGFKYALAGPFGVIATGLSVFSMINYFRKHRGEVIPRAKKFREIIAETHATFDGVLEGYGKNRFSKVERDMMVDGLMSRLLTDLIAVDGNIVEKAS